MIVEAHVVRFDSISLDGGATLAPVELAYETYGSLNAQKSNAILILHAFSGDAHAAGVSPETGKPGWWDNMIGPGKAFDTNKYFAICSNVLGGCRGTTGPASINPATGCPYAMSFPVITIRDMVRLQKMLIDHLGIARLLSLSGGSMGGMQALEWAVSYPESVVSTIPIAATARHSAQQIAFNEVGRQAIIADPDWSEGNYYTGKPPARGLAVARMVGHITYMSDDSMREKFGRRLGDRRLSDRGSARARFRLPAGAGLSDRAGVRGRHRRRRHEQDRQPRRHGGRDRRLDRAGLRPDLRLLRRADRLSQCRAGVARLNYSNGKSRPSAALPKRMLRAL